MRVLTFGFFCLVLATFSVAAKENDRKAKKAKKLSAETAQGLQVTMSDAARAQWPSVGQLSRGAKTRGICTGTLISPTHVLTAAHCVSNRKKERITPFHRVLFRAGWHHGDLEDASRAKSIAIHPEYFEKTDPPKSDLHIFATDLAIIELQEPLEGIATAEIGEPVDALGPVSVMGYQRSSPDALIDYVGCARLGIDHTFFGLSCAVRSGTSGAPVFERRGDRWVLVGVVVATTGKTKSEIKGVAVRVNPEYLQRIFPEVL